MRHLLPTVLSWVPLWGCTGNENNIVDLTPEIAVSPEALDFGPVVANEQVLVLEAFVTNGGREALTLDVSVEDPAFTVVGESTFVVEIDGALTIPIQFAPTELADYAADLVFTSDDPDDGVIVVPLTGVGRVPYAPDIELRADDGQPATVLDFGTVNVASPSSEVFYVANVGDADLHLGSVSQTGAGTFELTTDDPSGTTVAPGQQVPVIVTYSPIHPNGDSGTFEIPSDDLDEPLVSMGLEANGGGDFDYPVAVIDCPPGIELAGPIDVVFDGSASFDPSGAPIDSYSWELIRLPAGTDPNRALDPADAAATTLLVDAAGEWEVSLQVTSANGPSVPAKCVFPVTSIDDLHVELSWAGPTADLDLHLALEDAELFTVPGDTCWCNRAPDWGIAGDPLDDGHLDLDDSDGYGPEHAGVTIPANGVYVVRVHHYDDGEDGDVTAEVSVFVNSALVWNGSKVLARNEVWDVGQVNWPDGTFGVGNGDPWDAEGVRECR